MHHLVKGYLILHLISAFLIRVLNWTPFFAPAPLIVSQNLSQVQHTVDPEKMYWIRQNRCLSLIFLSKSCKSPVNTIQDLRSPVSPSATIPKNGLTGDSHQKKRWQGGSFQELGPFVRQMVTKAKSNFARDEGNDIASVPCSRLVFKWAKKRKKRSYIKNKSLTQFSANKRMWKPTDAVLCHLRPTATRRSSRTAHLNR